jgi:Tfp pilus assembly protein PilV
MVSSHKSCLAGTTLIETLVAVALLVGFFVTIFELNAVCLRYIDSSKESVAALQGVQDRVEGLRNLSFANLTSPSYMITAQPTPSPSGSAPVSLYYPSNASDFAARVTETVKLSGYPSGSPTITFTRAPGAGVTPTHTPSSVDFSTTALVKLNVTYTWTTALGGRSGSEQTETIISAGTKK